MIIELPYNFSPRSYQREMLDAFFLEGKKHFCEVWHRRAGKTKVCVNILSAAAHMRVGLYIYLFPELKQARRSVWDARGEDGIRFIDHYHPELVEKVNNTEMAIYFKNGSIIRHLGSDRYSALRGMNALGVIYDEYAEQNPVARDVMVPMLAENKGWEIFIFTPRGGNHAYKLYEAVKSNPKWHTNLLTVEDTKRDNGEP